MCILIIYLYFKGVYIILINLFLQYYSLNYTDFLKDSANKDKISQKKNIVEKANNISNNLTIEDYKNENKQLKEQINNLKKEIDRLNQENKKQNDYIKQINNLKEEINRLNQDNKKQNDYISQINNLKIQLKEKDKEINDLKNKISKGNVKQYVDYNDIMVVHFNSGDGKIDHGIKCLPTETFAEVEEKLYKIYDEYRETNTIYHLIIFLT